MKKGGVRSTEVSYSVFLHTEAHGVIFCGKETKCRVEKSYRICIMKAYHKQALKLK